MEVEADALGQLEVLPAQGVGGAEAVQQLGCAPLVVRDREGCAPVVGVGEDLRDAVDELEQQVGALEEREPLVLARGLEHHGPGGPGAMTEVGRHHVGRHAIGGERLRPFAEALEVGRARAHVVDQPPHHQVDVPAHPGADVLARGPEAAVLGPVPEAVQDPVGEQIEVRALDDAPDRVARTGAGLHGAHRLSLVVQVHMPRDEICSRCVFAGRARPGMMRA
jgi:hypothetical protein